ncbi:MAG: DUF4301 family protein, partial [Bacteroidales bacterium]|nr:DUF4301 family protein [Bacteroidales bacterium]
FKSLYEYNEATNKEDLLKEKGFNSVSVFFEKLKKFAFYDELKQSTLIKHVDFDSDLKTINYHVIINALLSNEGMAYGNLPKGLLKFHKYPSGAKTPVQEHMVEGALYAASGNEVLIHFTVSPEHMDAFKKHIESVKPALEAQFEMSFTITYSIQKPSTDTIAVDLNNNPFREDDGSLLFRPGGHGALIQNLNELDADLIFIKNIDNVVPDRLKQETVNYKKALAGLLFDYQAIIFTYLEKLNSNTAITEDYIAEIEDFVSRKLCIIPPDSYASYSSEQRIKYLTNKLNRPIRVCGMVKNEGEPGGGPFWAVNSDGSSSLQIVEGSQIDMNNSEKVAILNQSSHFNPVDLVCAVRDFKGIKFDLTKYIDPATGFISEKSKDGKKLKALELPGLWNGAMSDWNTIFVEVALITFNPVKTVNDLLRPEHQPGS